MKFHQAIELLRGAIAEASGTGAHPGAGTGAFTRALAQPVGSDGHVIAIAGDARAVRSLRTLTEERVGAEAHLVLRDRDTWSIAVRAPRDRPPPQHELQNDD